MKRPLLVVLAFATCWPVTAQAQLITVSGSTYIAYDWIVGGAGGGEFGHDSRYPGFGLPVTMSGDAHPGGSLPGGGTWGATPTWSTLVFADRDEFGGYNPAPRVRGSGEVSATLSPLFCTGWTEVWSEADVEIDFKWNQVRGVLMSLSSAGTGSSKLIHFNGSTWDTVMEVSGDQSMHRYLDMSGRYMIQGRAHAISTDSTKRTASFGFDLLVPEPATWLALGLPMLLLRRKSHR